jgi:hypothetical protein
VEISLSGELFLCWISRSVFGFISVQITVVRKFLDYLFDWLLSKKDSASRINLILSFPLRLGFPCCLYLSGPPLIPLCVSPVPHRCHMNGLISFQFCIGVMDRTYSV